MLKTVQIKITKLKKADLTTFEACTRVNDRSEKNNLHLITGKNELQGLSSFYVLLAVTTQF
jgi:hypothetical protein